MVEAEDAQVVEVGDRRRRGHHRAQQERLRGLSPRGMEQRRRPGRACPDLDAHAVVFKLLPVEEALGMTLTCAFQLVPEQSTAAMIVHHPEAKYYAVRGVAGDAANGQRPAAAQPGESAA